MPLRRRRPLMAATVVGGTAYVAGKAGANAGAAQAAQQPQAVAQPAQQPPAAAQPAQPPAAPPAEQSMDQQMDQLAKLKQLLDMGALTQDEFDAKKATILATM
jgi:hypothetical protein